MTLQRMLLDGEWRKGSDTFTVTEPYGGGELAEVARAGAVEIEASLAAAERAAVRMRDLPRFEISAGLRKIAEAIAKRKEEFTLTIARESAKPVIYARAEVERGISTFSWAAGEAERFVGEIVPIDIQASGRGKWGRTLREPRGVIYGITPFNFPLNLVAHKVAPALASGNAIIIKPSEKTPLTALLLGEAFLESGLPPESLQIVPTAVENVEAVMRDDRVGMISFTGSAPVGWRLKSKVGIKPIALELGGNAPIIIDRSADIGSSVSKTVTGAFAYSGQVCISVQRIFVHDQVYDDWVPEFVASADGLERGDPLEEPTRISVMIDDQAAERAEEWLAEAEDHGAEILLGGPRDGAFIPPTVVTNANPELKVVSEEVFAPIVVVERVRDINEAVDRANASKYGLQASVFSRSSEVIEECVRRLRFGGVIVNDSPSFRVDNMPYGGMKESGFGREGVRYAMDEMTEPKLVVYDR